MTRLFWKLFLALWLSIMGFSLVMAWVNAVLVQQAVSDTPEQLFNRSVTRAQHLLQEALQRDGVTGARDALQRLPRHYRNQVYLFDEQQHELLGRDEVRRRVRAAGVPHVRRELRDAQGHRYQMMVLRPGPPARLLEPGPRGAGLRLLAAALISAVLSFFIARYLARPLERLGHVGRELGRGDLQVRVGEPLTRRRDEFGALARDLDRMAGNLDALQQANRRLLRDVSHELRSPLARLRVALEIARNRGADTVATELDRIERESERLESLVDEVLGLLRDSSAAVPLNLEEFDLCDLLEDLRDVVAYEVPEGAPGIRLQAERPLRMLADRELLWRALENLLRNALVHSDAGQEVTLSAVATGKGELEIRVEDHGPGIPPAELDRVFDAFYRVQEARDRQSGGHGLGLAIAAAAVRRHHGRIEAQNRPGGGLAISVTLPARQ